MVLDCSPNFGDGGLDGPEPMLVLELSILQLHRQTRMKSRSGSSECILPSKQESALLCKVLAHVDWDNYKIWKGNINLTPIFEGKIAYYRTVKFLLGLL